MSACNICGQDPCANPNLCAAAAKADSAKTEKAPDEKVVDRLIRIAVNESRHSEENSAGDEAAGGLFHTSDFVAFGDIPIRGRRETRAVRSKAFKQWLIHRYFEINQSAPGSEAVQTAIALAEARANIDGPEREVFVRIAAAGGRLYLDLANEAWQAIEIDSRGWRILDSNAVPVRFKRAPGMLPLPTPAKGGSIEALRSFLNVSSDSDFELAVAWLLAALRHQGPFPVLALVGEHGAAKTTFAGTLRSLVDPNKAPLRSLPRENRDLAIAANNSWVCAFDNVSSIPQWLSDAICRLATGGGFATRRLYTDDEEALFDAKRPVILTGIEDYVSRPDLADRTVFISLLEIPDDKRRAEQEMQADLDRARPQILGALLDLIVLGLQRLPHVVLARKPRMADFALWATACERRAGAFMRAYDENRLEAVVTVLEGDLVATAIRNFVQLRGGAKWSGTATSLLSALTAEVGESRSKGWPSDSARLSGRLKRAAPALRKIGIRIEFTRQGGTRGGGTRLITITSAPANPDPGRPKRNGKSSSPASPSSPDNEINDLEKRPASPLASPPLSASQASPPSPSPASPERHQTPLKNNDNDAGDGGDGDFLNLRGGTADADDAYASRMPPEPTCVRCGIPSNDAFGALTACGPDGSAGLYHVRCWMEERTKGPLRRPALGPLGDSLEDFK